MERTQRYAPGALTSLWTRVKAYVEVTKLRLVFLLTFTAVGTMVVAAAERDPSCAAGRVTRAMTSAPWFVGGTDRLTTRLMRTTQGRLLAKFGAEAVYCVGDREHKLGIAIKVEDGHRRAVGAAVLEFLQKVGHPALGMDPIMG